jgi:hypothetical protein
MLIKLAARRAAASSGILTSRKLVRVQRCSRSYYSTIVANSERSFAQNRFRNCNVISLNQGRRGFLGYFVKSSTQAALNFSKSRNLSTNSEGNLSL